MTYADRVSNALHGELTKYFTRRINPTRPYARRTRANAGRIRKLIRYANRCEPRTTYYYGLRKA
jgi:hypothetical protein